MYETDCFTEAKKMKMGRLRNALLLHRAALTLTDDAPWPSALDNKSTNILV